MGRIISTASMKYKLGMLKDRYMGKAKALLNDDEKIEKFLQECEELLFVVPAIGDILSDIPTIISMLRAYLKKEYTDVSNAAIISLLAGMLYFAAPVDFVPDFIPGMGKVDDIAILAFVIRKTEQDLEKYKEWQKQHCLRQ